MRLRSAALALIISGTLLAPPARAASITLELVATGLVQPVHVAHAGDGSGRLFIVERAGVIKILRDGAVLPLPFIDITSKVGSAGLEQGLLSVAFHPAFASNGEAFLSYTDRLGQNVIERYRVSASDPDRLDASSAGLILTQFQPFANHNGGLVAFGPDGYLYVGIGDGGLANDPLLSGQNPQTLLGTILRLDVDQTPVGYTIPADNPFVGDPAAADEIWAYGLRNPWRFSFDRLNGDLHIADVGQNQWEEIDLETAGGAGGNNYGWNRYEGTHEFRPEIFPPHTPYVFPVLEYNHSEGCSITGGSVYRGPAIPSLSGIYVFGEYCRGTIWGMTEQGGEYAKTELIDTSLGISSFGEDEAGEIYVAHLGLGLAAPGAVYRLVAS